VSTGQCGHLWRYFDPKAQVVHLLYWFRSFVHITPFNMTSHWEVGLPCKLVITDFERETIKIESFLVAGWAHVERSSSRPSTISGIRKYRGPPS
jgi:hypothetical protein